MIRPFKKVLWAALFLLSLSALYSQEKEIFTLVFDPIKLNFDPAYAITTTEAQIFTGIFEGLVTYHPSTLEPIPAIAKSWKVSADKKTYTFLLRKNARYSNGEEITARHFKDAWLRLLSPETKASYSSLLDVIEGARAYRVGQSDSTKDIGINTKGPRELIITLEKPASHFLNILCHHSFVPWPQEARDMDPLTSEEDFYFSGPFYPQEREDGSLILLKNKHYWESGNVALESIHVLYEEDAEKATALYNSGVVHWIPDNFIFDKVNWKEAIQIDYIFATSYLFFQCVEPPFNDAKVRRGLAQLLPWEEIRKNQFFSTYRLVPQFPSYPEIEETITLDIESGLQALEEAGFPKGEDLPPLVLRFSQSEELLRIGELMKKSWQEHLTVDVEIERIPFGSYFDSLTEEGYTMGSITWIGDFADPLTFLQMWTSDSNLNDSGYSNAEYDALIENSLSEPRPDRFETQAEAERILLGTAAVLPLGHSVAINLVDTNHIEGWYSNPLDIHPFKYLAFREALLIPNVVMAP